MATEKDSSHSKSWSLDDLLKEIGRFGRYQIIIYTLISIPVLIAGANSVSFVFTAGDVNYRCHIPECEELSNSSYNTSWIDNAIPSKNKIRQKCLRFEYLKNATSNFDSCDVNSFNTQHEIECNEFVYETDEKTLATRVNIDRNLKSNNNKI